MTGSALERQTLDVDKGADAPQVRQATLAEKDRPTRAAPARSHEAEPCGRRRVEDRRGRPRLGEIRELPIQAHRGSVTLPDSGAQAQWAFARSRTAGPGACPALWRVPGDGYAGGGGVSNRRVRTCPLPPVGERCVRVPVGPGRTWPACSASRRRLFRSTPDSNPSTNARAVACGSTHLNRPVIRAMAWSNSCQRAASMPRPAATARSSGVSTTPGDHAVAVSVPAPVLRWCQACPYPPVTEAEPPPISSDAKKCDQKPERLDPLVLRKIGDLCQLLGEAPARDQHGRGVGRPDAGSADALRSVLAGCAGLDTEPCHIAQDLENTSGCLPSGAIEPDREVALECRHASQHSGVPGLRPSRLRPSSRPSRVCAARCPEGSGTTSMAGATAHRPISAARAPVLLPRRRGLSHTVTWTAMPKRRLVTRLRDCR